MEEKTFATAEDLTETPHLEVDEHQLPSGKWVRLRGLSSFEVHLMRKVSKGGDDTAVADQLVLSMGMIEPALSKEGALKWMKSRPAGEATDAVSKIRDLSGLNEGAPKAAYKSLRGEPTD